MHFSWKNDLKYELKQKTPKKQFVAFLKVLIHTKTITENTIMVNIYKPSNFISRFSKNTSIHTLVYPLFGSRKILH